MKQLLRRVIKSNRSIYRAVNWLRGSRFHQAEIESAMAFLGSEYGGWALDLTGLTDCSIVYSVGVGEDVSFDIALLERTQCKLYAFDPTPIATQWVRNNSLPTNFHFFPIGLSNRDGEVDFFVPPVPGFHSLSREAEPTAKNKEVVRCKVNRLESLMRELGHSHIDVLKMDIEGFEYEVIDDLIDGRVRPNQILVEFHHGIYGFSREQTREAVARLRGAGYKMSWVSDVGREYCFRRF
jgi:FkbM family methyltransferase